MKVEPICLLPPFHWILGGKLAYLSVKSEFDRGQFFFAWSLLHEVEKYDSSSTVN